MPRKAQSRPTRTLPPQCCRRAGASTALVAVAALAAAAAVPHSHAAAFAPLPDVIVCSVDDPLDALPWDRVVFYVSVRLEDGGVLYKSLTSNPLLLTLDADGVVRAENLQDCDGRSADELRRQGRAFDFA